MGKANKQYAAAGTPPAEFIPVRTRSTPPVQQPQNTTTKPLPHNVTNNNAQQQQQQQQKINYASIVNKSDSKTNSGTPTPPIPNQSPTPTPTLPINDNDANTSTNHNKNQSNHGNDPAPNDVSNVAVDSNATQQQSQPPRGTAVPQPRNNTNPAATRIQQPGVPTQQFVPVGTVPQSLQQQQQMLRQQHMNQRAAYQSFPPAAMPLNPSSSQLPPGMTPMQYEQYRMQQQMYTRGMQQQCISSQYMKPGMPMIPHPTLLENLPPAVQAQVLNSAQFMQQHYNTQQQYAAHQQLLFQQQQQRQQYNQQLQSNQIQSSTINNNQYTPVHVQSQPSPVPSTATSNASPSLHPQPFGQYGQSPVPAHAMLPGTYNSTQSQVKSSMSNVLRSTAPSFNVSAPVFAPGAQSFIPAQQQSVQQSSPIPTTARTPGLPLTVPSNAPPGTNPYATTGNTLSGKDQLSAEARAVLEAAKNDKASVLEILDENGQPVVYERKARTRPKFAESKNDVVPAGGAANQSLIASPTPSDSVTSSPVPPARIDSTMKSPIRSHALPIESPERELDKTPAPTPAPAPVVAKESKQSDTTSADNDKKETQSNSAVTANTTNNDTITTESAIGELTAATKVLNVSDDSKPPGIDTPTNATSNENTNESFTADKPSSEPITRYQAPSARRTKPIEPIIPVVDKESSKDDTNNERDSERTDTPLPIQLTIPAPSGPPYIYTREFLLQFQSQINPSSTVTSEIRSNAGEILIDSTGILQSRRVSQSSRGGAGGGTQVGSQYFTQRGGGSKIYSQQPVSPPTRFESATSVRRDQNKPLPSSNQSRNNNSNNRRNNNQRGNIPLGEQPMDIDIRPIEHSE